MAGRFKIFVASSVALWCASFAFAGAAGVQKTTNTGVYNKAQADGARKQFQTICAECHAFTAAAKKKPRDVTLGEQAFFDTWRGRELTEMVTLIHTTMPNDGSAEVSEQEAVNLVAYILQQNGFPAGPKPLTLDTASAVFEPPKKR